MVSSVKLKNEIEADNCAGEKFSLYYKGAVGYTDTYIY